MIALGGKLLLLMTRILIITLPLSLPFNCKANDYSLEGKWINKFTITMTSRMIFEVMGWGPEVREVKATSELRFGKNEFDLIILDDRKNKINSYSGTFYTHADSIFFKPYPPKPDTVGWKLSGNGDTLYRIKTLPVDTSLKMMNFKFINNDSLLLKVFDLPALTNGMEQFDPVGFVWGIRDTDAYTVHLSHFQKRSGIFIRQK